MTVQLSEQVHTRMYKSVPLCLCSSTRKRRFRSCLRIDRLASGELRSTEARERCICFDEAGKCDRQRAVS